jgi:hypothetical protein
MRSSETTTEHTLAAITRLRRSFLGEIPAGEACRIADRIDLLWRVTAHMARGRK